MNFDKYIWRLKKGEINITIKNLLKLSNALHILLPEFLSDYCMNCFVTVIKCGIITLKIGFINSLFF